MMPYGTPTTWHCFGVIGEAVRIASELAHLTACPKADKQWHIFETEKRFEPGHPFYCKTMRNNVIDDTVENVTNSKT